jgi:hypothetical protein
MLIVLRTRCWLLGTVLLCAAGCSNVGQGQLVDQTLHPGPAEFQQKRATQFDPYTEQETYAGPRDASIRPRDYSEPIPEADRGRWVVTAPGQTSTATRW